ncbi:MAG: GDP-mannose 4,6-dehydratase [Phycisphaeraceae bacterium]|nr:GDP-mannose 4,6-dehydratase [Phycisphaeraceae bacterium]
MRILVTGAAGFVGSRLSKVLLERGDQVLGLDNLNDYYDLSLKERHLADLRPHPGFSFTKTDLCDAPAVAKQIASFAPQAIAHLAAMAAVRYSVQHPLIYGHVNVQGTMNLLDAARPLCDSLGSPPRCVIASTGSVYGSSTPVPFKEDAPADRPLAPYPASKRAMELMAHSYHHLWHFPTTILRFFNVYGPHGRPDMMPWQWSAQILKDQELTLYDGGKLKRDWTYVDDIVAGFVSALDKPLDFEIINLGCGRPVDNLQIISILESLWGKKARRKDIPAPPSEPKITYADVTKARKLLGYDPKTPVEQGLKHFVTWLQAEHLLP